MACVFLSYSRDDRERAQALAAVIADYGHEVWWDMHLVGGDDFQDVIEGKLSQVDAIIVLWTESSVKKPWVWAEANLGLERDCLICVRYAKDVVPPKAFAHLHAEYLGDWIGAGRAPEIDKLVLRVDKLKSARDQARIADALPPTIRKLTQKSNLLSAILDSALPGGLRLYRFLLGGAAAALVLWGLEWLVGLLAPEGDYNFGPGRYLMMLFALLLARGMDQVVIASKNQSSDRFFDRAFAFTFLVCTLLGFAVVIVLALFDHIQTGQAYDPVEMVILGITYALVFLVLSYVTRALLLAGRMLHGRV
jgi:hypothetical protein